MEKQRTHIVDVLFVLALFGVFALSALILTSIGADVYRHTVDNMQTNYETRTAASYLEEKVRRSGEVRLTEFSGATVMFLPEIKGDQEYATVLYYYDDYLRELYVRTNQQLGSDVLAAGQKITELGGMDYEELENGMTRVTLTLTDGATQTLLLHSYGSEE